MTVSMREVLTRPWVGVWVSIAVKLIYLKNNEPIQHGIFSFHEQSFLELLFKMFFFPESKEIYNPQSCIFRIAHLSPGYTLTIPHLPATFPDFMCIIL